MSYAYVVTRGFMPNMFCPSCHRHLCNADMISGRGVRLCPNCKETEEAKYAHQLIMSAQQRSDRKMEEAKKQEKLRAKKSQFEERLKAMGLSDEGAEYSVDSFNLHNDDNSPEGEMEDLLSTLGLV